MRSFGQFFIAGVAGILGLKILGALVLPLIGLVFGFLGMLVKFALIAAVIFFVLSFFKRRREPAHS